MHRLDRRHRYFNKFENQYQNKGSKISDNSSEDVIDINSVFGSSEKVMFTKTFKGGTINCAFGGGKINLTQADMEDKAILTVSVTFGGAEIIVPSNWNIQNELTAFMGGIEDKRRSVAGNVQDKTLILRGSIFCGGVEIMN
jgi:predicted membrane protein